MQVEVKFDADLQLPPIVDLLANPGPDEDPNTYVGDGEQQTKATGIIAPLLKLNNTTIQWTQIRSLRLYGKHYPQIRAIVNDIFRFNKIYDNPGPNGTLQLQIIPPFDNGYKKINLMFYITDLIHDGNDIIVEGKYFIPKWNDTIMKAYGEISTYEFFEQIAKQLKLGYCSNLSNTDDKRWIYIANKTANKSLLQECNLGGSQTCILDYWVDYWNNINLVDVYERYQTIDKDIKVWINTNVIPKTESADEITVQETEAMISNKPHLKPHPLFCQDMKILTNLSKNVSSGTDKINETYNVDKLETNEVLVVDGCINNSKIIKYRYLGEEFGDTTCLMNYAMRDSYMQKLQSQMLEVKIGMPCFGFMRGSKINLYWYELSEVTKDITENEIGSNIPLPENETPEEEDQYLINGELSGQYYIYDCTYEYVNNGNMPLWTQTMILARPAETIETYITEEDRPLDESSFNSADKPNENTETSESAKTEASSFLASAKAILENLKQ